MRAIRSGWHPRSAEEADLPARREVFRFFHFCNPMVMSPRGYFRPRRNFNIAPFLRHFQATAGCKSLSQQTVARRIRLFAGKLVVGQPKPVESALQKGYNNYVMDPSFSRNLTRLRKAAGLTLYNSQKNCLSPDRLFRNGKETRVARI